MKVSVREVLWVEMTENPVWIQLVTANTQSTWTLDSLQEELDEVLEQHSSAEEWAAGMQ